MPSIIDLVKESLRQTRTQDKNYAALEPYFFLLRGPAFNASLGWSNEITFPLPLNPMSLTYALPFAAEVTPLQQGGVIAEENGIQIGNLTIEATMGFALKPIRDTSFAGSSGEFTGELGKRGPIGTGTQVPSDTISGQMHFWRLANRCFDAYSELKKDPALAPETEMEFHSQKDDLHLKVIPKEFTLTREPAKNRVSYSYRVVMDVIGPAAPLFLPSPDLGLLDQIKNVISNVRKAVQAVAATVDDLTAALDEISRTLSSVVGLLDDIASVANAFEDLVAGTVNFLSIPKTFVTALADQAEAVADAADALVSWPKDVGQAFRGIGDEMDRLALAGRGFWMSDWRAKAAEYNRRLEEPLNSNTYRGGASPDTDGTPGGTATTSKVSDVFGAGGTKPGDARRALTGSNQDRLSPDEYAGFEEKVVGAGDTLQSLAAKHLGDARKWLDLAVVNDLVAPFITNGARIPRTLSVGKKVVIPIKATRATSDVITTGDPEVGDGQVDVALGQDFYLAQEGNTGRFGWRIDTRGGSVDVMKISGVPNFSQALEMRFRTIQGENILYPQIGLPRLVGQRGLGATLVAADYGTNQQLRADKRTARVVSSSLTLDGDKVVLDAEVQPVGYSGSRTIQRTLT